MTSRCEFDSVPDPRGGLHDEASPSSSSETAADRTAPVGPERTGTSAPAPASSGPGSQDLSAGQLVDELCLFFEDAWLRGRQPHLEPLVQSVASPLREDLFRELLPLDLAYRRRRGENPSLEDYERRFPDLTDAIRQAFPQVSQPAPLDFSPGAVIDRYQIERELGRGAFGTVFLAEDLDLGRQVAIKIPGAPHAATSGQIGRLLEEARAAAQLQHPSIVSLYDVQPLPDGRLYAVMKYVAGRSLREQLDHQRPPLAELAEMFAVIADGLAYAHERGFVHRDLSPSNILLDNSLRPMIADFGLAIHERALPRRMGEQAGSWSYMAPEQVRGETHRLDGRTDIWALGVMLYEALTGRRPFLGETPEALAEEIQHRDPKPPRQIDRDIPATLEHICLNCLSKSPADRYRTAGDLANALRTWDQPARRMGRRHWLVAGGGLLALASLSLSLRPVSPPSPDAASSAPRVDRLDLLVWRGQQWTSVDSTSQLPLQSGDQIRFHLETRRPWYLYLVWLDAQGATAPVYPWRMGSWSDRTRERPLPRLELPLGGTDRVWTMETGPLGTELVLLLGRETPLPDDLPLEPLLADLPHLPPSRPPATVRFDFDGIERRTGDRHIDPGRVERVQDPAWALQRVLAERLRRHFAWLQAVAFPTGR
jgi:serine/threonine protein kinase